MTAAGTSHAEPTQRGCQPAWESIRIALVRLPKIQLHDRNTCLVRNHHQMENSVSCREGMEGRRPNATLGTGRRGVALLLRARDAREGLRLLLERPAPPTLGFTDRATGRRCSAACDAVHRRWLLLRSPTCGHGTPYQVREITYKSEPSPLHHIHNSSHALG